MKKIDTTTKKLLLATDTVRRLSDDTLRHVVGGGLPPAYPRTGISCACM